MLQEKHSKYDVDKGGGDWAEMASCRGRSEMGAIKEERSRRGNGGGGGGEVEGEEPVTGRTPFWNI